MSTCQSDDTAFLSFFFLSSTRPIPIYTTNFIYLYLLLFLSFPSPLLIRGANSIPKRLFNIVRLEQEHLPVPHHPHLQQRGPLLYVYVWLF